MTSHYVTKDSKHLQPYKKQNYKTDKGHCKENSKLGFKL